MESLHSEVIDMWWKVGGVTFECSWRNSRGLGGRRLDHGGARLWLNWSADARHTQQWKAYQRLRGSLVTAAERSWSGWSRRDGSRKKMAWVWAMTSNDPMAETNDLVLAAGYMAVTDGVMAFA